MAHAYHQELGLPTVSVRPFNVFGPGQIGGGAIRAFIEAALAGRDLTVHGDGSQIRAWCYVDDMVDGLLLALEHPNAVGESFNIGNARSAVTIFDLARRIKAITGCPGEIVFQPLHYLDVELRIPNVDKARDAARVRGEGRAGRGARTDGRVVSREDRGGHRVTEKEEARGGTTGSPAIVRLARPDTGAEEARRGRRGARERDADHGREGRRARGRARPRLRGRACGCGLVRDGRDPPRGARARDRPGRRGDRPRVHVSRDGERRRAGRRETGAGRRRSRDVQHRPQRRSRSRRGRRRSCPSTCSAGPPGWRSSRT